MYQIQLYDYNCSPIIDGVIRFFVDDLESFEKNWIPHIKNKRDEDRVTRYMKSKEGEIVTDYYSDDPRLNIVQKKHVEIISEKSYTETDVTKSVNNAYGFPCTYHMDSITYHIRYIRNVSDGEFLKLCRYEIKGICSDDDLWGTGMDGKICRPRYKDASVYGNPFVNLNRKSFLYSDSPKDYKDTEASLYVWHIVKIFEDKKRFINNSKHYRLGKLETQLLLQDFPGEAG